MPRDGSGNFSLAAGNPVVPGTLIDTTWANPTLEDIAAALTGSLPRDGSAPMNGNLVLSGNNLRIRGDFTNSTLGARTLFQTTIANGSTSVGAIPNGTGVSSAFTAYNSVTPDNSSFLHMQIEDTRAGIKSLAVGTGTVKPLIFTVGTGDVLTIDATSLTVVPVSARIRGDFSTVPVANRVLLQTSIVNGLTSITAIPNGISTIAGFAAANSSDPDNSTFAQLTLDTISCSLRVDKLGTGSFLPITLHTGGAERMRVDVNGLVGVGVVPTTTKFEVRAATNNGIRVGDGIVSGIMFASGGPQLTIGTTSNHNLSLFTNNIEKVRIEAAGNTKVVSLTSPLAGFSVSTDSFQLLPAADNRAFALAAAATQINWACAGAVVGSISCTGVATAYNTASDYRLKENVAPFTDGLAVIGALQPYQFNWKVDGSVGHGFLAHEIQSVISEIVTGEKDAVDENGAPVMQMIDYSKAVPYLVAAIKELLARVEALEAT